MNSLYTTIAVADLHKVSPSGQKRHIFTASANGHLVLRSTCDGIASIVALDGSVLKNVKFSAGSSAIVDSKGFLIVQFLSSKGLESLKVFNN